MESQESHSHIREPDGIDVPLTSIESTILATLQHHTHLAGQIIDVPRLQEECADSGLTATEFSHGFVRLLTRRLLEPRGDFTFSLSAEGHRLKDTICDLTDSIPSARAFLDGTANER